MYNRIVRRNVQSKLRKGETKGMEGVDGPNSTQHAHFLLANQVQREALTSPYDLLTATTPGLSPIASGPTSRIAVTIVLTQKPGYPDNGYPRRSGSLRVRTTCR